MARAAGEIEWRNATAQLGLYDEKQDPKGGIKKELKRIDPNRFLTNLMKTGGTAEDRQYNEAVVALAALANGDIDEKKYLELRQKHHIAVGKPQEDAAEQAERDLKNSAELIHRWEECK